MKKISNMTKEELDVAIQRAQAYYASCVDEWGLLEQECRQADAECDRAEDVVTKLLEERANHGN